MNTPNEQSHHRVTPTERGQQFAERLSAFGGAVVRLVASFPKDRRGRHVADQLLRSGTAAGAHYEEARGAQSSKDFIHKISLALKELREAQHWLRVARTGGLVEETFSHEDEGRQLVRMLAASKRTAQRNQR